MSTETSVNDEAPTIFRGVPSSVEGIVRGHFDQVVAVTRAVRISAKEAILVEQAFLRMGRVGTTATRMTFSLPPATPEGVYQGTIEISGVQHPIEVIVEGRPSFTISPKSLSLTAVAGGEATAKLTIVNEGNAVGEVPRVSNLDMLNPEAFEAALVAMVHGNETQSGSDRVNTFADELHRNYGGLLNVELLEGSGPIGPGEVRHATVHLLVPESVREGQTYRARWPLAARAYSFEILVVAPGPDVSPASAALPSKEPS